MSIKVSVFLFLAMACSSAFSQDNHGLSANDLEKKMLVDCQNLAKELNKSKKLSISLDGIQPLVTWRASCAERPPTGLGNVTALCEGKRVTAKGEEKLFFWEKSNRRKFNTGYLACYD